MEPAAAGMLVVALAPLALEHGPLPLRPPYHNTAAAVSLRCTARRPLTRRLEDHHQPPSTAQIPSTSPFALSQGAALARSSCDLTSALSRRDSTPVLTYLVTSALCSCATAYPSLASPRQPTLPRSSWLRRHLSPPTPLRHRTKAQDFTIPTISEIFGLLVSTI